MSSTKEDEELIESLVSVDLSDGIIGFTRLDQRDANLLLPVINQYATQRALEELEGLPKSEIGKLANHSLKVDEYVYKRIATLKQESEG